jgi:hypothetical protein
VDDAVLRSDDSEVREWAYGSGNLALEEDDTGDSGVHEWVCGSGILDVEVGRGYSSACGPF